MLLPPIVPSYILARALRGRIRARCLPSGDAMSSVFFICCLSGGSFIGRGSRHGTTARGEKMSKPTHKVRGRASSVQATQWGERSGFCSGSAKYVLCLPLCLSLCVPGAGLSGRLSLGSALLGGLTEGPYQILALRRERALLLLGLVLAVLPAQLVHTFPKYVRRRVSRAAPSTLQAAATRARFKVPGPRYTGTVYGRCTELLAHYAPASKELERPSLLVLLWRGHLAGVRDARCGRAARRGRDNSEARARPGRATGGVWRAVGVRRGYGGQWARGQWACAGRVQGVCRACAGPRRQRTK